MNAKIRIRALSLFTAIVMTFVSIVILLPAPPLSAAEPPGAPAIEDDGSTPVEKYGRLQVRRIDGKGYICAEDGEPVQLRGMSTFGMHLQCGYWLLEDGEYGSLAFEALAKDWKCDIIRACMYIYESYAPYGYAEDPAGVLAKVERIIELCADYGMYVMIDWHTLTPGNVWDPIYINAGLNMTTDLSALGQADAIEALSTFHDMPPEFKALYETNPTWNGPQVFFAYLAQKYGHLPNIIYEPSNEPNGTAISNDAAWIRAGTGLKAYYDMVLAAIRLYDERGLMFVATGDYSNYPDIAVRTGQPVTDSIGAAASGTGVPQIAYTLHTYTGSEMGSGELPRIANAVNGGYPVFISEWGTSTSSGDNGPWIFNSEIYLNNYVNPHKVGWTNWHTSRDDEDSSAFSIYADAVPPIGPEGVRAWPYEALTRSGAYIRSRLREEPLPMYDDQYIISDFGPTAALGVYSDNLTAARETVIGNNAVKITGVGDDTGGNSVVFENVNAIYGQFQDLKIDVYLEAAKLTGDGAVIRFLPAFGGVTQYTANAATNVGTVASATLINVPRGDFADVGDGFVKAMVRIPLNWDSRLGVRKSLTPQTSGNNVGQVTAANQGNANTVRDVILNFALTGDSAGSAVYFDLVAFSTYHLGEYGLKPFSNGGIPPWRGGFISLPWRFETIMANGLGNVEGWQRREGSGIGLSSWDLKTYEIEPGNRALGFPMTFRPGHNQWYDNKGIVSASIAASYNDAYFIANNVFSADLYYEKGKATQGGLGFDVEIQYKGKFRVPTRAVDVVNGEGEFFTAMDGRELYKVTVFLPLSAFDRRAFSGFRVPTIQLHMLGHDCDYSGMLYLDNIGFVPYASAFKTVTFDSNGGSYIAPVTDAPVGCRIDRPSDPERDHYVFLGWYKDAGFTEEWDFDADVIKDDMTLIAKWREIPLSVTPTASVDKLNGNQNRLHITVTELYRDGPKVVIQESVMINNNAAGFYTVGGYKVYVDTKGNTQIRECYIVK